MSTSGPRAINGADRSMRQPVEPSLASRGQTVATYGGPVVPRRELATQTGTQPSVQYVRTRCLMFYWAGEKNFQRDLQPLFRKFDEQFHFEVQFCPIPGQKGDQTAFVADQLKEFRDENESNDELLIVVYGGHGIPDKSTGKLLWQCRDGISTVAWNGIQDRVLFNSGKDTFVFLDCCYAGAADRAVPAARKDILAACDGNTTTRLKAKYSFTTLTVRAIEALPKSFTIPTLVAKIESLRVPGVHEKPYYVRRPSGATREIWIAPSITRSNDTAIQTSGPTSQATKSSWTGDLELSIGWGPAKIRLNLYYGPPAAGRADGASRVGGGSPTLLLDVRQPLPQPEYKGFRQRVQQFFTSGRVFAVPWSPRISHVNRAATHITHDGLAAEAEEKQFIVVQSGTDRCMAVPIVLNMSPNAPCGHGVIFDGKQPRSLSQHNGVCCIGIAMDSRMERIDGGWVDYTGVSILTHRVPVRSIGVIRPDFRNAFLTNLRSFGPASDRSQRDSGQHESEDDEEIKGDDEGMDEDEEKEEEEEGSAAQRLSSSAGTSANRKATSQLDTLSREQLVADFTRLRVRGQAPADAMDALAARHGCSRRDVHMRLTQGPIDCNGSDDDNDNEDDDEHDEDDEGGDDDDDDDDDR